MKRVMYLVNNKTNDIDDIHVPKMRLYTLTGRK